MVRVSTLGGLLLASSVLLWCLMTVLQSQQLAAQDNAEVLQLRAKIDTQNGIISRQESLVRSLRVDIDMLRSGSSDAGSSDNNNMDEEKYEMEMLLRERIGQQESEIDTLKAELRGKKGADATCEAGSGGSGDGDLEDTMIKDLQRMRRIALQHNLSVKSLSAFAKKGWDQVSVRRGGMVGHDVEHVQYCDH